MSPGHIVSATLYNSQYPGPLIRLQEGKRVVVDVYNNTDVPELVHWHGQMIPSDVDGSSEGGHPFIAPHGMRRIAFVPKPAGLRFVQPLLFSSQFNGVFCAESHRRLDAVLLHIKARARELAVVMLGSNHEHRGAGH